VVDLNEQLTISSTDEVSQPERSLLKLLAPKNILCIVRTLVTLQCERSLDEKARASWNIPAVFSALDKFHAERSLSKDAAPRNMFVKLLPLSTFQRERSLVKWEATANEELKSWTCETFHEERSLSKPRAPEKRDDMSVTELVSQVERSPLKDSALANIDFMFFIELVTH
jgi:hypothetical protein